MILEFRNIEKSFGEKKVLKSVSFTAESGKAFGLLGRNGAGKTTSIRILMNVFPQNAGEVLIDGKPIDYNKVGIGYLPEERCLYPKKTILDQLCYFAELNGLSHKEAVNAVDYWLERLQMSEYRLKRLDTLSKGNQQKIQLVTALAHNPDIVILDEPFSGLDPVNAMLLKDIVKEQIETGKIVLFSSHQMNYIEEFCDSIAILKDGSIAIGGDLADIKKQHRRNRLVVKCENPELILKAFPLDSKQRENGDVLVKFKDDNKTEIMKKILDTASVDSISIYEPTLGDIFVEYTADEEERSDSRETV